MKLPGSAVTTSICVAALLCGGDFLSYASANPAKEGVRPPPALRGAVAEIERQCPENYPERVQAVPDRDQLARMKHPRLIRLLGHWNPALRKAGGEQLAKGGVETVPELRDALDSEDWRIRAGALHALTSILSRRLRNWEEVVPEAENRSEAVQTIQARHARVVDAALPLMEDKQTAVRRQALTFFIRFGQQSNEIVSAILERFVDEDEFIAQEAMIMFEKRFSIQQADSGQLVRTLKQALGSPLPRGRGHVVRMISRMDPDRQRQFVPELLAHLEWQPDRDTMFGAGGQKGAIEILTELGETELIPRLPGLMDKRMRGPGLFEPVLASVRSFGGEAKIILPELRACKEGLEEDLSRVSRQRHKESIQEKQRKLNEVIHYVENL